jgi:hypothetical protein
MKGRRSSSRNCAAVIIYVEGIENQVPQASFEQSFSLSNAVGRDLEAAGFPDVNYEDALALTIQNFNNKPLYLAIFDLDPSGQIDSLLCKSGGDLKVVRPKNEGYSSREEIE